MTWLYLILFLAGGDTATIVTGEKFEKYEQCAKAGEAELFVERNGGIVRGFGCLNVTE